MSQPTPVEVEHDEAVIRFRDVHKAFGPKVIYEGLDLDVYKGETLTIIGGSGMGKSVMLKMLIRLLKVDSGSVTAFGEEVTTMPERGLLGLRRRIAMLFQGAALFDSLTVAENIRYPLVEHGWGTRGEMDKRVAEVLEMVGMPGIQDLKPSELSGGMKKRVGLARAIAINPDVILYDEPTTGLDPLNVRRINGLILDLQQRLGVTSLVVTHDMDSCFTVANRIAFLYRRKMSWVGTPEQAQASDFPPLMEFVKGGKGVLESEEVGERPGQHQKG
ncbi:MAG: ATP-binding cassette domain-containing protein [Alphaproteobacteria bacterium]|nr:ATP-binding cassette domain-containing protein [Alphaproteobacteria bacterium]MCB9793559.1 ATP-binding cassette domain-containing protein [Alphaproteobacteria bacterium]